MYNESVFLSRKVFDLFIILIINIYINKINAYVKHEKIWGRANVYAFNKPR